MASTSSPATLNLTPRRAQVGRRSAPVKASLGRRIFDSYKQDHTHPVNNVLHLAIGWPLVGAALFVLPFEPLWALGMVAAGYAAMFIGHFVFEGNVPTILKHPTTPFVMAWAIIRGLGREGLGFLKQFGIRESAARAKTQNS